VIRPGWFKGLAQEIRGDEGSSMKGSSSSRRLHRNRRSHIPVLALLSVLLFVIAGASLFFCVPHLLGPGGSSQGGMDRELSSGHGPAPNLKNYSNEVLKIASSVPDLTATINERQGSGGMEICLNNAGSDTLRNVRVLDGSDKAIGIIPQLTPGESRTIVLEEAPSELRVIAEEGSGKEIAGRVKSSSPSHSSQASSSRRAPSSSPAPSLGGKVPLEIKEAHTIANPEPANQKPITSVDSVPKSIDQGDAQGLSIFIEANKTEGLRGEVAGYRCSAVNLGDFILYDMELTCCGKLASTKFLQPGREMHIDGFSLIDNLSIINASVRGNDSEGTLHSNSTKLEVREVSPELRLKARGPAGKVHRGEEITLSVEATNAGGSELRDIRISDSIGLLGTIGSLKPGQTVAVHRTSRLESSLLDKISAEAMDLASQRIYASTEAELAVLSTGINLTVEPSDLLVYPGDTVEAAWIVKNTGEESLKNVTLIEDGSIKGRLKEILPGKSVRVSAIYTVSKSTILNVVARAKDTTGASVQDESQMTIRAVVPGISLKVAPEEITASEGSLAEVTCLVTNNGDDDLKGISIYGNGSLLEKLDRLGPGEFKVTYQKVTIGKNGTIPFSVKGLDSRGKEWSDRLAVNATTVTAAVKISAAAAPAQVRIGQSTIITCTVENIAKTPLFNVFVISETFGPLGTIDFLSPGIKRSISAEKTVTLDVQDIITAEGFTSGKVPIRDSCMIEISLAKDAKARAQRQIESAGKSADAPAQISSISPEGRVNVNSTSEDSQNESRQAPSGALPDDETTLGVLEAVSESESEIQAPETAGEDVTAQVETGLGSVEDQDISSRDIQEKALSTGQEEPLGGVSGLIRYIKSMLQHIGVRSEAYREEARYEESSRDGEEVLGIESIRGSERGQISILDVTAIPPEPSDDEPVRVSVHVQSGRGAESVALQWGVAATAIAKSDVLSVERIFVQPMTLDAGDGRDGYWSCTLPGRSSGTYMSISVTADDGEGTAENGPYMIRWNDLKEDYKKPERLPERVARNENGLLYIESTTVSGVGEVSIKDKFHESTISYEEKMKGYGAVNLESVRTVDKGYPVVNFSEERDLNFEGQLKGIRRLDSPTFHGGMGASVTERFNLVKLDKSETDMIRSINTTNNTLAFKTEQSFDGMWNIRTQYSKFYKKIKADQKYTGQFETHKDIEFQD
jgi:hypothetical protein